MDDYQIQEVINTQQAEKVGHFLTSKYAFEQTWAPNEKALVEKAPVDSLNNKNHKYWFVEADGQIVGAAGVRENKYGSGGFEMDSDYIAVHKEYRRKGIAKKLLEKIEDYVKTQGGRYIHVVSCDIDSYKPAGNFYLNAGYKEVSHLPNYYVIGEGRIDFYKEL